MADSTVPVPLQAEDVVPSKLPPLLRIQSLSHTVDVSQGGIVNEAVLYHDKVTLRVMWGDSYAESRLRVGSLVSIWWLGNPVAVNGAIRISRLVLQARPQAGFNLFESVPNAWVKDRQLVSEARDLWELLPRGFRHVFNAMFWDSQRFQRYLMGPGSVSGHHSYINGNFRHSVEVVKQAMASAALVDYVYRPLLILAGFLHDAGKADEYRLNRKTGLFYLSERGRLVGHKHTVLEWLAVARAEAGDCISETRYLGLVHCLTAIRGAAPWMGMREPLSLESTILSNADRLSGQSELVGRHAPQKDGFGRYHPHLGGRPFVLQEAHTGA